MITNGDNHSKSRVNDAIDCGTGEINQVGQHIGSIPSFQKHKQEHPIRQILGSIFFVSMQWQRRMADDGRPRIEIPNLCCSCMTQFELLLRSSPAVAVPVESSCTCP
jgi:hypothetical protein